MGALIDGLLDFSRLGRKGLTLKTVDMNTMVREIWDEQFTIAQRPDMQVQIGPLPEAMADEFLMRQVWYNLISNAIKYSANSSPSIISITGKATNNGFDYSISDNGVGFDMKYVNKIFGVFQRLHTDKEFEGIGVGLSFVKRIVTKHKGKIWVESEINKGTTFYFSIPHKIINPIT